MKPGAQRPDLPGATVAFSRVIWSCPFPLVPIIPNEEAPCMCPSSQARRSGGLAFSSSSGPRLAQPLRHFRPCPSTGYCLSRSTSIIFGYSPPGQRPNRASGASKSSFYGAKTKAFRSQMGLSLPQPTSGV